MQKEHRIDNMQCITALNTAAEFDYVVNTWGLRSIGCHYVLQGFASDLAQIQASDAASHEYLTVYT